MSHKFEVVAVDEEEEDGNPSDGDAEQQRLHQEQQSQDADKNGKKIAAARELMVMRMEGRTVHPFQFHYSNSIFS